LLIAATAVFGMVFTLNVAPPLTAPERDWNCVDHCITGSDFILPERPASNNEPL
jgi:hypothetical protein